MVVFQGCVQRLLCLLLSSLSLCDLPVDVDKQVYALAFGHEVEHADHMALYDQDASSAYVEDFVTRAESIAESML